MIGIVLLHIHLIIFLYAFIGLLGGGGSLPLYSASADPPPLTHLECVRIPVEGVSRYWFFDLAAAAGDNFLIR